MALSLRGADRHADHILDVVRNGLHEQSNDVVRRSWSRCLNEYQLHPDKPHEPAVVDKHLSTRLADATAAARQRARR